MGILNVTPDSFYAASRTTADSELLRRAERMLSEGATILDIGGYSSRPGAADVPEEEECNRILPAIRLLHRHFPHAILSIDTFRSTVAQQALEEGAAMINDISGGQRDPNMIALASKWQVPYICMHMRGTPQTMQEQTTYTDLMTELLEFFHQRIAELHQYGVKDIIIDPGFGFAKNVDQNFTLLKNLDCLRITGKPLLVGLSRKSMIWRTLDITPDEALNGTTALHMAALLKGASILRVHDVKEATETIRLFIKLRAA
jgi:dihydropteroate synthase